jgi:serine/threonine protein kinase
MDEVIEAYNKTTSMKYVRKAAGVSKNELIGNESYDYVVKFEELGVQVLPRTVSELETFLCHVLEGLKELHHIGFVHRDVRWPNVLWFADVQCAKLIDLDCGSKVPAAWPAMDVEEKGEDESGEGASSAGASSAGASGERR